MNEKGGEKSGRKRIEFVKMQFDAMVSFRIVVSKFNGNPSDRYPDGLKIGTVLRHVTLEKTK